MSTSITTEEEATSILFMSVLLTLLCYLSTLKMEAVILIETSHRTSWYSRRVVDHSRNRDSSVDIVTGRHRDRSSYTYGVQTGSVVHLVRNGGHLPGGKAGGG
jgi:adenylate kinase